MRFKSSSKQPPPGLRRPAAAQRGAEAEPAAREHAALRRLREERAVAQQLHLLDGEHLGPPRLGLA
eukprot:6207328-Pleurochrysis_carterae.AAC.1